MPTPQEYWEQYHTQNQSIRQVASHFNVSTQAVHAALKRGGYSLRPAPPTEPKAYETVPQFGISDRQRQAIQTLGLGYLSKGLRWLYLDKSLLDAANIGTSERYVRLKFPHLTQEEQTLIEHLSLLVGGNHSAVIRSAIEVLITNYSLIQFARPDDWQPRPAALRQGGENPIAPLEEPARSFTVMIPPGLWHYLGRLDNLSDFARGGIADAQGNDWHLSLPEEEPGEKRRSSLLLLESQHDQLEKWRQQLGWKTKSQVLLAVLRQQLEVTLQMQL